MKCARSSLPTLASDRVIDDRYDGTIKIDIECFSRSGSPETIQCELERSVACPLEIIP